MAPQKNFAEIFSQTIDRQRISVSQICQNLRLAGFSVNKSTLTRWRLNQSLPSMSKMDVLRHLPAALLLKPLEAERFLDEISQSLGFKITAPQSVNPPVHFMQFRKNLGYEVSTPFAGRQNELIELTRLVLKKQSIFITGLGGVGKTRLAQELVRIAVKEFAHGCEYLEVTPNQTSLHLLRNIAHLLHLQLPSALLSAGKRQAILDQIRFQTRGIDLLFLVDNVEHADQVRDLISSVPDITWIFTARQRVNLKRTGIHMVHLESPPLDEAVQIFMKYSPLQRKNQAQQIERLQKIADQLGRLPLALRLCANLLENGIFESLEAMQTWLNERGLLKSRSFSANLRYLFDYMLERLPQSARKIFELSGLFARPRIQVNRMKSIIQKSNLRINSSDWDLLGDLSMFNYPDEQSIEMHPLLHEYARLRVQMNPQFPVFWQHFIDENLRLAKEIANPPNESDRNYWLLLPADDDLRIIVNDAYIKAKWQTLAAIFPALTGYLWSTGNFQDYEDVEKKCLDAAVHIGDQVWQAKILSELGFLKFDQKKWLEAECLLVESQSIYDLHSDLLFDQARVRRYRALVALAQNQLDHAEILLNEAEERLSKSTDPRLNVGLMWMHGARMRLWFKRGLYSQAETEGLAAQRLYDVLNKGGGYRISGIQILIGDVFMAQKKRVEAVNAWKSSLPEKKADPLAPEHADALIRLGWAYAVSEDVQNSIEALTSARALFARFGMQENLKQAEKLFAIIQAEQALPDFLDFFKE